MSCLLLVGMFCLLHWLVCSVCYTGWYVLFATLVGMFCLLQWLVCSVCYTGWNVLFATLVGMFCLLHWLVCSDGTIGIYLIFDVVSLYLHPALVPFLELLLSLTENIRKAININIHRLSDELQKMEVLRTIILIQFGLIVIPACLLIMQITLKSFPGTN